MKHKLGLIVALFCLTAFSLFAQREVTIYDIQYTTDPSGVSPYNGQTVIVNGIVSATGYNGNNYFISEDESGPWTGLYVSSWNNDMVIGDSISITGTVSEFTDMTGIYPSSATVFSSNNPLPDPYQIETALLASEEKYEGIFAKVDSVIVTQIESTKWYVDDGSGDCKIGKGIYDFPGVVLNQEFVSIAGIVDYSLGEYGLNPRDANDLIMGDDNTPPTINLIEANSSTTVDITFSEIITENSAENLANYSIIDLDISLAELSADSNMVTLTTTEQNLGQTYEITIENISDVAGNTMSDTTTSFVSGNYTLIAEIQNNYDDYAGTEVTVCGIVTIGTGLLNPVQTKFYLQDYSGRGIQIFDYDPQPTTYDRGDKLEVTGIIDRYNSDVELTSPTITLIDTQQPLPPVHPMVGNEDETWNGTWSEAVGFITDVWDASQYGFYQITVEVNGNAISLMFWESTGADVSEYIVGDFVACSGIIAFYEGSVQLVCGYEEDICIPPMIINATSTSTTSLKIYFDRKMLRDTAEDTSNYNIDELEISQTVLSTDSTEVEIITSKQLDGETYKLYVENLQDLAGNTVPAGTNIDFVGFIPGAISLRVPAKTFCPTIGETFEIIYNAKNDVRAILRLYNAHGNLVKTFVNEVMTGSHLINWDGKDENWNTVSPGLYICHLETVNRDTGERKTDTAPIVISIPLKN